MSGMLKSIYNYFFGESKRELPTKALPQVDTDYKNHRSSWTECEQEKELTGPQGGGRILSKLGGRFEGRGWKESGIESSSIQYGSRETPNPQPDEKDKWNYSDFATSLIKAAGIDDMENNCDDVLTRENDFLPHTNDAENKERENINSTDPMHGLEEPNFEFMDIDLGSDESLPILPDLSSDDSSNDDDLKGEGCSVEEKIQVEEANEQFPRGALVPWACQNDSQQVSAPLPSMPDLNSPEIGTNPQVLTVIPINMMLPHLSGCSNDDVSNDKEVTNFIVLTGGEYSTPNNTAPEVQDVELKPTIKEAIPEPSITKADGHQMTLSCKDIALGEMYQKLNQGSIQIPLSNSSSTGSPKTQTKKLMDVSLHSRLAYNPETNPTGTLKCSALSTDFSTQDSMDPGNVSPAYVRPFTYSPTSRSPIKSYVVKLMRSQGITPKAASANRKFTLVKSKVNSGLSKNPPKRPLGAPSSAIRLPSIHPTTVAEKHLQRKDDFASPESCAARDTPRKSKTTWIGTPRPAPPPRASALVGNGSQTGGAEGRPGNQGDQHGANNPLAEDSAAPHRATPLVWSGGQTGVVEACEQGDQREATKPLEFSEDAAGSKSRVFHPPSSCGGKRSRCAPRDHGPSKKKKLKVDTKPAERPSPQSFVNLRNFNIPRSMRSRNPSVSYKI